MAEPPPTLDSPTDASEHDAAEQLVREHIVWMLALAERLLRDRALAEDVVQDALLNALRRLETFESRSSLKTWLHRITVNAAIDKLRQTKRRAEEPIDELLPEFDANDCRIEATWSYLASTEEILEHDDQRRAVHEAIERLSDSYRLVITLRDVEGHTTQEVAQLLNISEANVKTRLHRARAALKKLLEPLLRGGEVV